MEAAELRPVLARYGLGQAIVIPLDGGMINHAYKVEASGRSYALKRYLAGPDVLERVHEVWGVQGSLRSGGLPVPAALRNLDGEMVTQAGSAFFVLSGFIEGRQYPPGTMSARAATRMGEALEHLRAALALMDTPEAEGFHSLEWIEAHLSELLREASKRRHANPVDEAAFLILQANIRALEKWSGPTPTPRLQWLHGDYQWRNVLFDEDAAVVGIIDFDNLRVGAGGREVMRCFTYSFPEGAPEALAFFEGYARASGVTPEEALEYVRIWRYNSLYRTWPIGPRYLEPDSYQIRWDEFIRPPTGWWEANWERLAGQLADIAARARPSG